MKTVKPVALLACLLLCMLRPSAQTATVPLNNPHLNKPRLFTDIPDKQPLLLREAESLLDLAVGTTVNVAVAKKLVLNGTIVSRSNPADKGVKSVVVKSNLRQGTLFTFTRITEADGRFSYLGRLISRNGADALEIAREGEGYVIRKKNIQEIVNE